MILLDLRRYSLQAGTQPDSTGVCPIWCGLNGFRRIVKRWSWLIKGLYDNAFTPHGSTAGAPDISCGIEELSLELANKAIPRLSNTAWWLALIGCLAFGLAIAY